MDKFVRELEQLPKDRQKAIIEGLQSQIIAQAEFIRDEQPTKFLAYVDEEIEKADASMFKMVQESSREGAELGAMSEIYIWNKERKRVLVRLRDEVQTEPEQAALEPQQKPPKASQDQQKKSDGVDLPEVLSTKRVMAVFGGAIEKGWMRPNGKGGYEWIGFGAKRGRVQQCVYMCGQIFGYVKGKSGNDGANIPNRELEKLFGISGLYSRLIKCMEAKPQIWRKPIDEMMENITASTL